MKLLSFAVAAVLSCGILACSSSESGRDGERDAAGSSEIKLTPAQSIVARGGQQQFTASISSASNPEFAWNIAEAGRSAGTGVTGDGLLVVASEETLTKLTVTVILLSDPSKFASATVTVHDTAEVENVTVSPSAVTVGKGGTETFTASVTGVFHPHQQVTWLIEEKDRAKGTCIDANGVLTVDPAESLLNITVTAVSVVDAGKTGSATVYIDGSDAAVESVTISPKSASAAKGSLMFFRASVEGTNYPGQKVSWYIVDPPGGEEKNAETVIDAEGCLVVSPEETLKTLTIMAASAANSTKFAEAVVRVTDGIGDGIINAVTVTPKTAVTERGGRYVFAASVESENSPYDMSVGWRILESDLNAGTGITSDGLLIVNEYEMHSALTVQASSVVDPSKYGTATVTLTGGKGGTVESVRISPREAAVSQGSFRSFSASVTGKDNPAVSVAWSVTSAGKNPGTGITGDGVLLASVQESLPTLTVRAVSTVNPAVFDEVPVTVYPGTPGTGTVSSVTVSPKQAEAAQGEAILFASQVSGQNNPNMGVYWSILEAGQCSAETMVTSTGKLYVAQDEALSALTVRAVSLMDSSVYDEAAVSVLPGSSGITGVSVEPAEAAVVCGATADFSATVNGEGSPGQAVLWSIEPEGLSGTRITSTGKLIVDRNETLSSLTVRAVSAANSGKTGSAQVSLLPYPAPVVSAIVISPTSAAIERGKMGFFSAAVEGSNNPQQEVYWSIVETDKKAATMISSDGWLAAAPDEERGSLTIKAVSCWNPSVYALAEVTLAD